MGLLRILFRSAHEAVQEQSAKSALERKLGRKISKEELYSLGSHLDAAQPTTGAPPMPLRSTPRESSVPFADAKPPMNTRTKLMIFGVVALLVGLMAVVGAGVVVAMMPERQFNRLNPFTPEPPEGAFPAQIGGYTRVDPPDYTTEDFTVKVGPRFEANYSAANAYPLHAVWIFKSEAEARSALEAKRKYFKDNRYIMVADDAPRFVASWRATEFRVFWIEGLQLKEIKSSSQKTAYELEGLLTDKPPAELVDVKFEEPGKEPTNTNGLTVTVLQLLDDYKKDAAAADKKYKGKTIIVTGKVEVSDKDKTGKPMIAFMRPGSTAPKDGMVVCSFDKSKESSVSGIKKGDTVTLQGRVFGSILFSVMLDNCSKP